MPRALIPFVCALLAAASIGCRTRDDVRVNPAPPELVEVDLDGTGYQLSFLLPDPDWRRAASDFKGFVYERDGRMLRVAVALKRERFEAAEAQARAEAGLDVRAFEPDSIWPFVGIVVAYRGPSDEPMVKAFVRSFRVERR